MIVIQSHQAHHTHHQHLKINARIIAALDRTRLRIHRNKLLGLLQTRGRKAEIICIALARLLGEDPHQYILALEPSLCHLSKTCLAELCLMMIYCLNL